MVFFFFLAEKLIILILDCKAHLRTQKKKEKMTEEVRDWSVGLEEVEFTSFASQKVNHNLLLFVLYVLVLILL